MGHGLRQAHGRAQVVTGARTLALAALAVLALAACGEKPQTAGAKKIGEPAWTGTVSHSVEGWKPGDAKSWEEQMRRRAQQGQNEYNRTTGNPG